MLKFYGIKEKTINKMQHKSLYFLLQVVSNHLDVQLQSIRDEFTHNLDTKLSQMF